MKDFLIIFFTTLIASYSQAQWVNKHGQVISDPSAYVNKHGAVGEGGLSKYGSRLFVNVPQRSNAIDFDGSSDHIVLPPAVYFVGNFTIECWVYPRSFQNWARIIDFGNGPSNNNVLLAYTAGNSGKPGFHIRGSEFYAKTTIPLNKWTHIAATLNGNTGTIYINGVADATGNLNLSPNITLNYSYIGRSNWNGDAYANAVFDELRIWNKAKSASEILASMNRELAGNEQGLVLYNNFNQGVAGADNAGITTVIDHSGNDHHGSLIDFSLTGDKSNWVQGPPLYLQNDGSTQAKASTSAYAIKQSFPDSPDGYYWIRNDNINGGAPFRIYADMTTDGGGWTLIMTNTTHVGWTYLNAVALNTTSPSVNSNYSIIGWADHIKRSPGGFQYMMDAQTRRSNGGIWTANENYSFTHGNNSQTNVTRNVKFGTWEYHDSSIEERMPWYVNCNNGGFITTSNDCTNGAWWGTLITARAGWIPSPWINANCGSNPCSPNPGVIWYWVR